MHRRESENDGGSPAGSLARKNDILSLRGEEVAVMTKKKAPATKKPGTTKK
jgi:hypothetical protein